MIGSTRVRPTLVAVRRFLVAGASLVLPLLMTPVVAAAGSTFADSDSLTTDAPRAKDERVSVDSTAAPVSFDIVSQHRFLLRHAFSLDHYLETQPGVMLVRGGPIGVDAAVSRYGFGRGRALVTLDGVPFNDPQDGLAPLAHMPTSAVGRLDFDPVAAGYPSGAEGVLAVTSPTTPAGRPVTFLELSKGTNRLRQRRVRFSSIEGTIGVDLSYDEILNDGYRFTAGGQTFTPLATDNRHVSLALRGSLEGGQTYRFTLRRFEGSTREMGLFVTDTNRRNGQIAALKVGIGDADVIVYGRSHDLATPDSSTTNQTNGASVKWRRMTAGFDVSAGVTAEDIDSRQRISGSSSRRRVTVVFGEVAVARDVGEKTRVTTRASAGGYTRYATSWGLGLGVTRSFGESFVGASVRRRFRLPTMAELFLPEHAAGGATIAGNADVGTEDSWEVEGRARLVVGPLVNELRASAIAIQNPISFRPTVVGTETWRVARAGEEETIVVLDDRWSVDARRGGFSVTLSGGLAIARGDRTGYFGATPEVRYSTDLRVGSTMFNATSALYATAEITHTGARRDFTNQQLPAFDVLNLKVDGHLLDARMYLVWFNVLNVNYVTQGEYPMTPRTFAFGITWTLFE